MSFTFPLDLAAPYPGLRPFLRDESVIFFGRDQQIDDVLARLKLHQFLGVVGTSGCGKSSLIRAGMLPALEGGLMGELGSSWFIADMKPGDAPLTNLAKALMQSGVLGDRWSNTPAGIALLTAALRRSDVSLVNLIQQVGLPKYTNLLVLADQFEEIFRFQQSDPNEALAFVNLLLATGHDRSVPIYVVLTMRSDFLGPCALFPGLPEALNDAQYLCPRLTRDQLAEAIEGPASVFGGEVERALVTQIVNDAGANSDQLPLVQHVLARMWHLNFGDTFGTGASRTDRVLCLEDYLEVGGLKGGSPPNRHRARPGGSTASALLGTSEPAQQPLNPTVVPSLRRRDERPGTDEVAQKPLNHPGERGGESPAAAPSPASPGFPKELRSGNALSQHADEAYFSLSDGTSTNEDRGPHHKPSRKQMIAQMLFRSLAERGPSGQYVRRPVKVQDVAAVAGCSVPEVIAVVEVFRREDRSFLVPPVGVTLDAQSVLDISHEALIRQWQRFGGQSEQSDGADSFQSWLAIEDQSRRRYRRLAEAAESEPTAGLLRDPELSFLDKWWQEFQPREAWGHGCVKDSFQRTKTFLARSRKAAQDEVKLQQAEQQKRLELAENLALEQTLLAEEQATRARVFWRMSCGIGLIAVVAVLLSVWALRAEQSANAATMKAKDATRKAEDEKLRADEATQDALHGLNTNLEMFTVPTVLVGKIAAAVSDRQSTAVSSAFDELKSQTKPIASTSDIENATRRLRRAIDEWNPGEEVSWDPETEKSSEAVRRAVLAYSGAVRRAWESQYRVDRATQFNRAKALTRRILIKPTYDRAIQVIRTIADGPREQREIDAFESLYWSELVFLETKGVEKHLVRFRGTLRGDPDFREFNLKDIAIDLKNACDTALGPTGAIVSGSDDKTIKIWNGAPVPLSKREVENSQPPPASAKPAAEVSPTPDHVPLPEPARSAESDSASPPVSHGTARQPAAIPEVLGFSLAALVSVGLISLIALTARQR